MVGSVTDRAVVRAYVAGAGSFVFTSTTSAFGRALTPGPGEPAAWITEDVAPRPGYHDQPTGVCTG